MVKKKNSTAKKESIVTLKKELLLAQRKCKKLEKIVKDRDKFISVAGHNLNTPLTGVKWLLNLLLTDKSQKFSVKQTELLNRLVVSNDRMINLVLALLDVSHIERDYKFDIVKSKTNIKDLIKQVAKDNVDLVKQKKAVIKINCANNIELMVDSDKIKQVFYILINNAIKYSKVKGKVGVICLVNKNKITFSIKDKGIGIPQKQQVKVFKKFLRGDNLDPIDAEGTGLSLYIAKAIVIAHGGKIWFESIENKGTTFFITIPLKGIKLKEGTKGL